jgi:hypothetical protein
MMAIHFFGSNIHYGLNIHADISQMVVQCGILDGHGSACLGCVSQVVTLCLHLQGELSQ